MRAASLIAGTVIAGSVLLGAGPGGEAKPTPIDPAQVVELAPFDFELLESAATRTHPIDVATLEGKVVVLTLLDGGAQSTMAAMGAERTRERFEDQGVVAIGIASDQAWEIVKAQVDGETIPFPVFRDTDNTIALALGAPEAGSLFVIDRAGTVRRANVKSSQLAKTVETLAEETPADAAVAAAEELESAEALAALPEIDAEAYAIASWPATNTVQNAKDVQGEELPVPFGSEKWLTEKVDLNGKVVILDFWATWCGPCLRISPEMAKLQEEFDGDLVVIGVSGQGERLSQVRGYLSKHDPEYSYVHDDKQRVYGALGVRAIPHVVVLSTDGVVRWQGNPHMSTFRGAVETMIEVDPMVAAKREARD